MSAPDLSRPIQADSVPPAGTVQRIVTDAAERTALAASFGLLSLDALAAELHLTRWKRDGVRVEGKLTATLSQRCIVSLEPVVQSVDETFTRTLVPDDSRLAKPPAPGAEIVVDAVAEDPPDVFEGGMIDLGAIVAEELALAIDPYPRAPGVALEAEEGGAADEAAASPFAALARLKSGDESGR